MIMNTKFTTFVYSILTLLLLGCTNYYRKGNTNFSNLQYHAAIENYKKAIAKNDSPEAKIKLAESYRLVNDYQNADLVFSEVVKFPQINNSMYFDYGKVLMNKGDYETAKIWFNKYLRNSPNDIVAKMLLLSCGSVGQFMKDTTLYTLKNIPFVGLESKFAQVPFGNGIVFTASRIENEKSRIEPMLGNSFYDLYFSEKDKEGNWLAPYLLKGEMNGNYHEGPATFNKAQNVIYFTRSNYFNSEPIKNAKNENNLKLFSAKLVDGNWVQLKELPFDSDDYSVGHPCLSADQKTLYFISDMTGGFGGTDIYYSVLNDTTWSKPENLGKEINTPGNEMFPFIAEDGTFYFSSNAHNNLGGLDVFATTYDANARKWLAVENLNYPVNSSKDDYAFVLDEKSKTGFLSSNRKKGDNIYEFTKNDPVFNVSGIVTLKGKGSPIKDALVTLKIKVNDTKENKIEVLTDSKGAYKFKLNPKTDYVINCSKENHFAQSSSLSTKGEKYSKDFVVNFQLDELIIDKPIVLENIYYDFDKYDIRADAAIELDKLVKILNDNPRIHIEMGSHTDCRGNDQYNEILSDNRAHAAVEYLVSQGIVASRLTYKGYGETVLVNNCKDGVRCSEQDHQKNRRTEFKVIKIDQMVIK